LARTVNAVLAATRILDFLQTRNRVPTGLTQIASEVGLYKGTCHDILQTLLEREYVVRDPSSRGYLLGPALVGLGELAVNDPTYVPIALEHLIEVQRSVGATCHVVQRLGEDQVQIAGRLEGQDGWALSAQVGQRFPLAVSRAAGRAFIAWEDAAERRALFARLAGRGFFAEFAGDLPGYEADLAQVRARGYALVRGFEPNLGEDAFARLAAPVFDRAGRAVLVVDVPLLGSAAAAERLSAHASRLLAATRAISVAIGGRLPADYPSELPYAPDRATEELAPLP
jgi:DNA-binding IclR family transcriptional regulator